MVLIYTKEDCIQCDATKEALKDAGHEYKEIKLEEDPDALEHFKRNGHKSAPIVVTKSEAWAGFQPDRIAQIPKE